MSKYTVKLELYTKHKEVVDKRNRLNEKRAELERLLHKQSLKPVLEDLENTKNCLNNIYESQEKINKKKTGILLKLQNEATKIYDKENVLVLPLKNHNDLQNIIQNKTEIGNLITNIQEKDNCEIAESTLTHSVNTYNVKYKQYAEDIQAFRSMEGLFNNVMSIKKMRKDKTDTSVCEHSGNESDLGCYPHESANDSLNDIVASTPLPCSSLVFKSLDININK